MYLGGKHVQESAISIVARVVDELIVESEPPRRYLRSGHHSRQIPLRTLRGRYCGRSPHTRSASSRQIASSHAAATLASARSGTRFARKSLSVEQTLGAEQVFAALLQIGLQRDLKLFEVDGSILAYHERPDRLVVLVREVVEGTSDRPPVWPPRRRHRFL